MDNRNHPRFAITSNVPASIETDNNLLVEGKLVDISNGGARVKISHEEVENKLRDGGDVVFSTLSNGDLYKRTGKVAWVGRQSVGVCFDETIDLSLIKTGCAEISSATEVVSAAT